MKSRLTLEERCEIAFKLRAQYLARSNPNQLEQMNHPEFGPKVEYSAIYAFEFWLDKFRQAFRTSAVDVIDYLIGFSHGTIVRDEERRNPRERIVRMGVSLSMKFAEEKGVLAREAKEFGKLLSVMNFKLPRDQTQMFIYELMYELIYELASEVVYRK